MERTAIFAENAMNTIPSTFNARLINRTLIGGRQNNPNEKFNAAAVLLNSNGSHLRPHVFDNLLACGFRNIVSVEPHTDNYNLEDLSRRYPSVKFLIPLEKASDGDLINLCMSELDASYVLVLRNTLRVTASLLLKNLFDNMTEDKVYCVVPRLFSADGGQIPVRTEPAAEKGKFKMISTASVSSGAPTLAPRDYIALYNREKFIALGGFDYTISSPYYQNADLALRSWLWGEKTVLSTAFFIHYDGDAGIADTTADLSYLRFYLKNILPQFRADHGILPASMFFQFFLRSSCGFFEALSQFKEAGRWVEKNKYRFKADMRNLIETWGIQK